MLAARVRREAREARALRRPARAASPGRSVNEIKEALEGGNPVAKATAMKGVISQLLNGETLPGIFITIVRYVLPSEDHTVQARAARLPLAAA